MNEKTIIPSEVIEKRIFIIRGQKVILDFHIAELYQVETKALKRAVKRNRARFPSDFLFELTQQEYTALRYQLGTLKRGEHSKYLPFAFTEQGIAMLSGVLGSPRAVQVNIAIKKFRKATNNQETFILLSQFAISFRKHLGGLNPYVYTDQGVVKGGVLK
jgi:hypothetical protein